MTAGGVLFGVKDYAPALQDQVAKYDAAVHVSNNLISVDDQAKVSGVGLVPDTQRFRNIHRHEVETGPTLITLCEDESPCFVNVCFLFLNAFFPEDLIQQRVTDRCERRNVVLMCSAVNEADLSALGRLEVISPTGCRMKPFVWISMTAARNALWS